MNQAINLRSTPRLPRKSSDYWQVNINHDELITRNVIDLSPSGLSFKAPQRSNFELGQTVNIEVKLETDKTFEVQGKIIWARDKQFGLKFSRIPVFIDSFIMKAIQETALATTIEIDPRIAASLSHFRSSRRDLEARKFISSTMGFITVAAMTAAFVMAAFLQQHHHPEDNLSNIGSGFFQKFNSPKNGPGPGS